VMDVENGEPGDDGGGRVVQSGGTVFLGEENIDTDAGAFADANPSQFRATDSTTLSLTNGRIDPDNTVSTYIGPRGNTIDVREARIQNLFVIDALSQERLDGAEEPTIEQPDSGDPFNVQMAIDYNYFESTSIDTDDALTQDGADVTDIYLEGIRDRALDPGGPFVSLDERSRTYDALFNFNIDDTGEYIFNAAPRSGDDRPEGRNVGFDDREDATDSHVLRIVDSGGGGSSRSVTASGGSASPGGRATVTVDAEDVTSVAINDIPDDWSVASSSTDGGQLIGNPSTGIVVSYATAGEQPSVSISVTFDIPSDAPIQDNNLEVVAFGTSGPDATDTATVSVQDCPADPVVCSYDPNGDIGTGELQQGINDFTQENIGTGDLQAIINAFLTTS